MLSQEQVREPRSTSTRHGKTTACTCARHTKKMLAPSEGPRAVHRNHKCVSGPLHLKDLVVGQLSSAFQLSCVGFCQQSDYRYAPSFAHATENDALQWDIFRELLCTSRFPSTKRFTRCPSDNPFSMSWLPIGIVHYFAFIQRVLSPLSLGFPSSLASIGNRLGIPLPFWEGVGSVTLCRAVHVALAPPSSEHVLRKVKQLKKLAPSLWSCFPVDSGTWREEHALRLCCERCRTSKPANAIWIALARPGSTSTLQVSFGCSASPRVSIDSSHRSFRSCHDGEEVPVGQLCSGTSPRF